MTAEVSVMNKKATALAADSAVTGSLSGDPKIFDSTNKLFHLSDDHPVGVMVFGNASFMNVPWETIIKMYGNYVSGDNIDTIEDHMIQFISYLETSNNLFSVDLQRKVFINTVYKLFRHFADNSGDTDGTIQKYEFHDELDSFIETCIDSDNVQDFDDDYLDFAVSAYDDIVQDIHLKNVTDIDNLDEETKRIMKEAAIKFASSQVPSYNSSGVIFAGYGNKQHFPAIISVRMEMILNGVAKYTVDRNHEIDHGMEAGVFSFAQDDMLQTFMEGVHPTYDNAMRGYIKGALDDIPDWVSDRLKKNGIDEKDIEDIESDLRYILDDFTSNFNDDMEDFRSDNYAEPIINTVKILPKGELANVAESLVNITSFKRKYSSANETVGGPIDVAVISKGDGFKWVNKETYLDE